MFIKRAALAAVISLAAANAAQAADNAGIETCEKARPATPAMRGFNKSHASFPKQKECRTVAASNHLSGRVTLESHGGHQKVVVRKLEPAEAERYAQN
jgi:hypothetical protein